MKAAKMSSVWKWENLFPLPLMELYKTAVTQTHKQSDLQTVGIYSSYRTFEEHAECLRTFWIKYKLEADLENLPLKVGKCLFLINTICCFRCWTVKPVREINTGSLFQRNFVNFEIFHFFHMFSENKTGCKI